jgi:hypothetical protein
MAFSGFGAGITSFLTRNTERLEPRLLVPPRTDQEGKRLQNARQRTGEKVENPRPT